MSDLTGCVTGRLQPVHLGHLELLLTVLERHQHLIVGITNSDPSQRAYESTNPERSREDNNPFTFFQRQRFVRAALDDAGIDQHRYSVVPFPLQRPELWYHYVPPAAVQYVRVFSAWEERKIELLEQFYRVTVLRSDHVPVRATQIRAAISDGGEWRHLVPRAVAETIANEL